MKTAKTGIIVYLALSASVFAQQDPAVPLGSLNVNQTTVREGVAPHLNWSIEYPSTIPEVVIIDPPTEVITTRTKLRVQVCVIGVGITDQYGNQYSASSYIHFSSSGWRHIFTGKGYQVNPWTTYVDKIVNAGEQIKFRAKLNLNGYPTYYQQSNNIKILKNGDLPPNNAAGYSHQTSAADYLEPYIDENGRLSLGPLDIIYAAELTHSNQNHYGFDLQDTIVLVRFTKVP